MKGSDPENNCNTPSNEDTRSKRMIWATRAVASMLLLSLIAFGAYYFRQSSIPPRLSVVDRDIASVENEIRQRPDDPELRVAAANLYIEKGRLDDAIRQAEQVLRVSPNHLGAILALAEAHARRGETDAAVSYLTLAIQLNQDNPMAKSSLLLAGVHQRLGTLYLDQGKTDQASSEFRQTLEINPGDADALQLLGNALEKQGQIDEAIQSYQQAVRYDPGFTEVYNDLVRVYDQKGDEARADYARGMLSYTAGNYEDAISRLQDAARALPDMPEVHLGLAMAYQKAGRDTEAQTEYHQVLAQDPSSIAARESVTRLDGQ